MNLNQKWFANTVLILVIIVLAGIIGYFVLVKKPNTPMINKQQINTITQPESLKIDDEIANWKVFKSELGFNLKYPEDRVTFRPTCNDGMHATSLTPAEKCESLIFSPKGVDYPLGPPPKSAYLFLTIHDNKNNLPVKNFIQQWMKSISHPYQGELKKEIIAGHEAYTFTYIGKGYALLDYIEKQKWIFIKLGSGKILSIENNFSASDKMFPLFERIISTVSFAD